MFFSAFHPVTRLLLGLLLLGGAQILRGFELWGAIVFVGLLSLEAIPKTFRLAMRARWLFLSLFLVFLWGTPGVFIWEGAFSPTFEGLQYGLLHVGRLFFSLAIVSFLFSILPLPHLLSAFYSLLLPLKRFGLDTDRAVVRLSLTLAYLESMPKLKDWRMLLNPSEETQETAIEITVLPLRNLDIGVLSLFCLLFLVVMLWGSL